MILRYHQERAAQAAAHLLARRGGRMSYMKLLKLLYLADRTALLAHGRPITYDRFVSMDHGPVLSQTYNLMVAEESPDEPPSYWRTLISEPERFEVRLLGGTPSASALSPAQVEILDRVYADFGAMGRWQLVEFVHTLPEWEDPHGSSLPITLRDVLLGGGMEEEDAEAVEEALLGEQALATLLD